MTGLALTVAVTALTFTTDDLPRSDLDKYQGTWILVSEEFEGKTVSAEDLADDSKRLSCTVRGDQVRYSSNGKDRSATVKLDPSKTPRTYDLVRDDGLVSLKGIYAWDGERIKICAADDRGDRPTEFRTRPGSKNRVRVWKRKP